MITAEGSILISDLLKMGITIHPEPRQASHTPRSIKLNKQMLSFWRPRGCGHSFTSHWLSRKALSPALPSCGTRTSPSEISARATCPLTPTTLPTMAMLTRILRILANQPFQHQHVACCIPTNPQNPSRTQRNNARCLCVQKYGLEATSLPRAPLAVSISGQYFTRWERFQSSQQSSRGSQTLQPSQTSRQYLKMRRRQRSSVWHTMLRMVQISLSRIKDVSRSRLTRPQRYPSAGTPSNTSPNHACNTAHQQTP